MDLYYIHIQWRFLINAKGGGAMNNILHDVRFNENFFASGANIYR